MALRSQGRIAAAERRSKALKLRKVGIAYEEIARECGYRHAGSAYNAVERALEQLIREPGEELRALELERLDRMQVGLWEAATSGKVEAVDRVLKIMERRAKLLGLDAPTRVHADVTSKGEAVGQSLQSMLSQLTMDELNALEPILARLAGEPAQGGPAAIGGAATPAA